MLKINGEEFLVCVGTFLKRDEGEVMYEVELVPGDANYRYRRITGYAETYSKALDLAIRDLLDYEGLHK